MRNIKGHKVNIPSLVIEKCWGIYSQKYEGIENNLIDKIELPTKNSSINLHKTGAFQIPISQLNKLFKDPLATYLISDNTNRLVIKLKTKVVLRGIDYYVGMQAISNEEKSKIIFLRLFDMVEILDKVTPESDITLYLALLDYIRNYLLVILYAIHQCVRELGLTKELKKPYNALLELINLIEQAYLNSLLSGTKGNIRAHPEFIPWLLALEKYLEKSLLLVKGNKKLAVDMFRRIRECNNPAKIFQFAQSLSSVYLPRNSLLIGIEYGGIELPFAVNAFRKMIGKSTLDVITINLSSYSIGSNKYVDTIEDAISPFVSIKELKDYDTVVIMDDSVTTGRTIEYLVNLLPPNIKSVFLGVVSFTNTNRYHHLTRFGHGGVNPLVIQNGIALYKSNFTQTYSRESYTNKRGVFDKEKNQIIKMLKHVYSNLLI